MTTEETKTITSFPPFSAQITISFVVLVLFLPFVNKAFNMDDPLFIWAAQHIRHNPLDFYGFKVNWYANLESMASVTKNPPIFSYYLAVVGALFGWSEVALHLAMMVPLISLALGTLRLAGHLGAEPISAALICVCTPVFMVSGTSVMCDVSMVALWVWALALWVEGLEAPTRPWLMLVAGFLIAASGLTKYFGASLIPLVAAYSLVRRVPLRVWLPYLLIPLVIFSLYEWLTGSMYGVGLFTDAFAYSSGLRNSASLTPVKGLIEGLSFTGGGLIVVLFLAGYWLRPKDWLRFAALGIFFATMFVFLCSAADRISWPTFLQQAIFVTTGCILLSASLSGYLQNKDAGSLLLALWVVGTFIFTAFVNWTVSERNLLPMAPAAGIILSRQLAASSGGTFKRKPLALALLLSLSLSLTLAMADYRWAGEVRSMVQRVQSATAGKRLWFTGHWGFQYYMELIGGTAVDSGASDARRGDVFVSPSYGTNLTKPPMENLFGISKLLTTPLPWITVMDTSIGAGFYSTGIGPHPFLVGQVKPEPYWVLGFKNDVRF